MTGINHYVPQFYLREFSINNDQKTVFGMEKDRIEIMDISKVAAEYDFFDRPGAPNTPMDDYLSKLERELVHVYHKVVANHSIELLSQSEREDLALHVALQERRTRASREAFKSTPEIFGGTGIEESIAKEFHFEWMIPSTIDLTKRILKMQWILWKNETGVPLVTSDHPVSRDNIFDSLDKIGTIYNDSPGLRMNYPITPKLLLCIVDENQSVDLSAYKREKCHVLGKDRGYFVASRNELQRVYSEQLVFSRVDPRMVPLFPPPRCLGNKESSP